jgi:hypothetical protein
LDDDFLANQGNVARLVNGVALVAGRRHEANDLAEHEPRWPFDIHAPTSNQ